MCSFLPFTRFHPVLNCSPSPFALNVEIVLSLSSEGSEWKVEQSYLTSIEFPSATSSLTPGSCLILHLYIWEYWVYETKGFTDQTELSALEWNPPSDGEGSSINWLNVCIHSSPLQSIAVPQSRESRETEEWNCQDSTEILWYGEKCHLASL